MYVTNVTVLKGDRGLTEVTTYDILKAVRVHSQACRLLLLEMLKSKKLTVLKINAMRKLHITKFYSKPRLLWITSSWPTFFSEELGKFIIAFVITQRKKNEIYGPLKRKYESWSVFWIEGKNTNLFNLYWDYKYLYFLVRLTAVKSPDKLKARDQ